MKFYFYTNKNIMFDFLARNIIAPDLIVKDIKKYRTIATASDYFLFITHKKLDRKSREQGIAAPEFVYPVTLELSEIQENDGQAVLVSKNDTDLEYNLAPLTEYDAQIHIGAYLIGEIPLSRVDRIYFDTQDDQDMFSRPSPDYWYPTNKFALLPKDFNEELTLDLEEDKILKVIGLPKEETIASFRNREKQRAALLNFVNATKKWQYDKYVFNIDSSLQQLFGLKDDDLVVALPHYVDVKNRGNKENICLVGETQSPGTEINQKIYDYIRETLKEQSYNTQKQPDLIKSILNLICGKIITECKKPTEVNKVRNTITEIERLISDESNKGPEEIMAEIPEDIDVLKALLFVAKNPNRYELFLEALDAYHADLITKRRAAVLWGALNGLYGMPGEDFNKDNQILWQFIEATVYTSENHMIPTLAITMPNKLLDNGTVLGIKLKEERIITAGEIRDAILATMKEKQPKLPDSFYNKLLEAAEVEVGSKKKAENAGYAHHVASVSLPEIKKGVELNAKDRKMLEQLVKDCKSSVPNEKKLFEDYVENESKFTFVFNMDQGYWKRAFKVDPESRNA